MKTLTHTLLLALVLVLATGCHHTTRPDDVMDADQMTAFLTEAYQLEGFFVVEQKYDFSTLAPEMVQAYDHLIDSLHLTREQVNHSLDYYSKHPEDYMRLHDSVVARLDRMQQFQMKEPRKFELKEVE